MDTKLDDSSLASYPAMSREELVSQLRDAVCDWQRTRDPRVKQVCAERIAAIDRVLGEPDASG